VRKKPGTWALWLHMFMCLPNLVEGQSQFPYALPMESKEQWSIMRKMPGTWASCVCLTLLRGSPSSLVHLQWSPTKQG
jgi:hypothetical protein